MKISNTLIAHLRWFYAGHSIDICIDICNQFGKLIPSDPYGKLIKQGHIRDLLAKGYLNKVNVEQYGIEYRRYVISSLGQECFKGYNDAHRK